MKHILKFLGLKIVEVGGACAAWYGLGCVGYGMCALLADSTPDMSDGVYFWGLTPVFGAMWLLILAVGIIIVSSIVIGLIKWIKWNWKITEDKENDYEGF